MRTAPALEANLCAGDTPDLLGTILRPVDDDMVAGLAPFGHTLGTAVGSVDKIQGYYFGRPMPADVMTQQLLGSGG